MKDSKTDFEKSLRAEFEGAEIEPDKRVWTGIKAALADGQIHTYKRKVLIYKLLAVASLFFAIGVSVFSLYRLSNPKMDNVQLTEISIPLPDANKSSRAASQSAFSEIGIQENVNLNDQNGNVADKKVAANQITAFSDMREYKPDDTHMVLADANQALPKDEHLTRQPVDQKLPYLESRKFDPQLKRIRSAGYPGFKSNPDDFYGVTLEEEKANDIQSEKLWAGVNFSSGVFNPNISYGNRPTNTLAENNFASNGMAAASSDAYYNNAIDKAGSFRTQTPEESTYTPEFSYSYGLNFGYHISKRFVLISGMSYLNNNSSTTVNSYIEEPSTNQKYPNQAMAIERASAQLETITQSTADIVLNNAYEFVSVPFNLGYYIVQGKFQWMMTAGLTTDFLLRNTISDNQNNLETIEFNGNGDTPYNPAYLNGTLGSQINYVLGDHYRFSLEPAYRYGISYLTKEDAGFNSRPSSFNISAGIAYIIR